jgi:hypothetical protein
MFNTACHLVPTIARHNEANQLIRTGYTNRSLGDHQARSATPASRFCLMASRHGLRDV